MWALYESYDPVALALYLDLVSQPAAMPQHPGLAEPKLLGTFKDTDDARKFADGYTQSLAYEKDKVVREVRCGNQRLDGCNGPGKPCYLGLDSFQCKTREGR